YPLKPNRIGKKIGEHAGQFPRVVTVDEAARFVVDNHFGEGKSIWTNRRHAAEASLKHDDAQRLEDAHHTENGRPAVVFQDAPHTARRRFINFPDDFDAGYGYFRIASDNGQRRAGNPFTDAEEGVDDERSALTLEVRTDEEDIARVVWSMRKRFL